MKHTKVKQKHNIQENRKIVKDYVNAGSFVAHPKFISI